MTVNLDIPELGTVVFVPSKRVKRLSISIRPFSRVRVTFPRHLSFSKAKNILLENLDWAGNALGEVRKIEAQRPQTEPPRITAHEMLRAKEFLLARLQVLADRHGFTYRRVSVRNQKTRWGSCSDKNSINLNIRLMTLNDRLRDYVILHELVHTKIKNHSKQFWACLDSVCDGQAEKLGNELKKYRLGTF